MAWSTDRSSPGRRLAGSFCAALVILGGSPVEPMPQGSTPPSIRDLSRPERTAQARQTDADVSVVEFAFVPADLSIPLGSTVTWSDDGNLPHASTADSGLWDSGTINPGSSFSYTFTTSGVFEYHCEFHPTLMQGTVTVGAATTPPARQGAGLVYDAARGQTVLFGGFAGGAGYLGDTWTWDGTSWTEQHPPNSPPARAYMGIAYDAARRQVVIFGGSRLDRLANDTWTWDGTNWTQVHPSRFPRSRYGPAMAYDGERRQIVLFGGVDIEGYRNDTWTWDGTTWTRQAPPSSPGRRRYSSMAFDRAVGVTILFGGFRSGETFLNDTWTWDGAGWTRRSPVRSPVRREGAGMAYDEAAARIVLFGGAGINGEMLADTWDWDRKTWTRRGPSTSPDPRWLPAMAYDIVRAEVVLFGGSSDGGNTYLGDTWTWDGVDWTER
jgi:plastocyanin